MHYFPSLYPDELFYSIAARYRSHLGLRYRDVVHDLAGTYFSLTTTSPQGRLERIARHLPPERGITAEQLSREHTTMPYYIARSPAARARDALAMQLSENVGPLPIRLGTAQLLGGQPTYLRFCPTCLVEMRQTYGEAYFRRVHQLPGVLVCPDHDEPLYESTAPVAIGVGHELTAASRDSCKIRAASAPHWTNDRPTRHLLLLIAKRSQNFLVEPPAPLGRDEAQAAFVEELAARDLCSGRNVRKAAVHQAYRQIMAPIFDVVPDTDPGEWLAQRWRKLRIDPASFRHVLIETFLTQVSEYPGRRAELAFAKQAFTCLLPFCEASSKPGLVKATPLRRAGLLYCRIECPECGLSYGIGDQPKAKPKIVRVGHGFLTRLQALADEGLGVVAISRRLGVHRKTVRLHAHELGIMFSAAEAKRPKSNRREAAIETAKERWLNAQGKNPRATRTELNRGDASAQRTLRLYVPQWLEENSPPVSYRSQGGMRVDWLDRDQILARKVRQAAAQLLAAEPPVHVRWPSIARSMRLSPVWLNRTRRAKLPQLMQAVGDVTETTEEFQARRIRWTLRRMVEQGKPLVVWKIVREAGLNTMDSPIVERELAIFTEQVGEHVHSKLPTLTHER